MTGDCTLVFFIISDEQPRLFIKVCLQLIILYPPKAPKLTPKVRLDQTLLIVSLQNQSRRLLFE